jgi:CBS domain-containing protein
MNDRKHPEEVAMLGSRHGGTKDTGLAVEPLIDAGRATLDALVAGRDAAAASWRHRSRGHRSYLWLGLGAAGALAVAIGQHLLRRTPPAGRRVGDVMVRDVQVISEAATIAEAARRMRDSNVGMLPILEGGGG